MAVDVATNAIDCIHTTAASHGRVFIVEIMGHKVGWLALYAGIAGGADIILLPEIPYDIDVVVNAIRSRTKNGKNFTILAVAEGAISKENAALTKKELKRKKEKWTGLSVGRLRAGRPDFRADGAGDPCDGSGAYAARRRAVPV